MASLLDTIPYRPTKLPQQAAYKHAGEIHKTVTTKNKPSGEVKTAALAGSILTTLLYLFAVAKFHKKQNFQISDIFKNPFKNMFEVMGLATSSVIGGLSAGLIADKKENRKPKIKEAIHQFLGNIVCPITIVGLAGQQIEKRGIKSPIKLGAASLGAAVLGVVSGVVGGNYLASKFNESVFNEKDTRKITAKDFGIHVDDLLSTMALTPIGQRLGIESFISVALPAIFLICGYEAGTKVKQDEKQHS